MYLKEYSELKKYPFEERGNELHVYSQSKSYELHIPLGIVFESNIQVHFHTHVNFENCSYIDNITVYKRLSFDTKTSVGELIIGENTFLYDGLFIYAEQDSTTNKFLEIDFRGELIEPDQHVFNLKNVSKFKSKNQYKISHINYYKPLDIELTNITYNALICEIYKGIEYFSSDEFDVLSNGVLYDLIITNLGDIINYEYHFWFTNRGYTVNYRKFYQIDGIRDLYVENFRILKTDDIYEKVETYRKNCFKHLN